MKLNVTIIRSKRKSISLRVNDSNRIEVRVPIKISKEEIEQFVRSKTSWIKKQIEENERKQLFSKQFDFERHNYILGKTFEKEPNFSYKNRAEQVLHQLAQIISKEINIEYKSYRVITSKRLWGSFSSQKELSLNYKCIILPENLTRYIIIHELCHSKEMNHSPKFWNLVKKFCPNYKILKKQLNDYSFLLKQKDLI